LENRLKDIDLASQEAEFEEEELLKRKQEFLIAEEKIEAEIEKIKLEDDIQKLKDLSQSFEIKRKELSEGLFSAERFLTNILAKEKEIENEKKIIEEEERKAEKLEERRKLEKERWQIGEKRREVEAERWEAEERKNSLESQLKAIKSRAQVVSEKINKINNRIEELDRKLGIQRPGAEKEEKEEKERDLTDILEKRSKDEKEKVIEPKVEEGRAHLRSSDFGPQPTKSPFTDELGGQKKEKESGTEEEKKIEEARKRIEALKRAIKEKKEKPWPKPEPEIEPESVVAEPKEDIFAQEQRRKELLERLQKGRKPFFPLTPDISFKPSVSQEPPIKAPSEVVRILPQKPSFKEKLWLRVLIVSLVLILLAAVFTFWYWYLVIRKEQPIPASEPEIEVVDGARISVGLPEGVAVPLPLFSTEEIRTLTISHLADIRSLISQVLLDWKNQGQFVRLIIRDERENKILGLREFFQSLVIEVPEDFYQKLENDFTLFIFFQKEGSRLGFITKIVAQDGLEDLLLAWERTMEEDFKTFFSLIGKEKPAIIPHFRDSKEIPDYQGPNFRYKTLIANDLGICYFFSDDYLIFTSSWLSMEEVFKRLE